MRYNEKITLVIFKIRSRRIEKGYCLKFMAHELGVSQNTYRKLELGVINLCVGQLLTIADVLELNLRELLKADSMPTTDNSKPAETIMHIAGIPFRVSTNTGNADKLGAGFISKAV